MYDPKIPDDEGQVCAAQGWLVLSELMNPLRALKAKAEAGETAQELSALAGKQAQGRQKAMESLQKAGALSARDKRLNKEKKRQFPTEIFVEKNGCTIFLNVLISLL